MEIQVIYCLCVCLMCITLLVVTMTLYQHFKRYCERRTWLVSDRGVGNALSPAPPVLDHGPAPARHYHIGKGQHSLVTLGSYAWEPLPT